MTDAAPRPEAASPPPIPGERIDPPPKEIPDVVRRADAGDGAGAVAVGVGFRALNRFSQAKATLLAAGTTYYLFLALFSLIALAYGVVAILDADRIASYLTQAISEAFPGLLGDEGIDPAELRSIGQTAGIIGLAVMLYAGGGAMAAAASSIHLIYGAPPDPRSFVPGRLRLLAWLVVVGPLIAFSFVAQSMVLGFGSRVFADLGVEGTDERILLSIAAVAVTLLADFAVVYVMLRHMGGIRPERKALVIGAAVGAVAIAAIRLPMALILELSLDKPQYGAFAVPIGVLLVLYFNAMILYGAAALTAGIAGQDVPLEHLAPITADPEPVDGPEPT